MKECTRIDPSLDNQIVEGNCFEVLTQIPDASFDLVVTDPPFNVLNKEDIKFNHRADIVQRATFDEFETYGEYLEFTRGWVSLVFDKMKPDSSLYVFFAAQYITDLLRICEGVGLKYKGVVVWHKTNPAPKIRKSGYLSSTEVVLFTTKGRPTFNFLGQRLMHNFVETPICMAPERLKDTGRTNARGRHPTLHPTQKPEKVYERFVLVSSNPGDLVLDPFAGTGTANVVCRRLGRRCLGVESNPVYVKAARRRLAAETSKLGERERGGG
ncbi:MAG: DNA-methyltransferase [Promethearchaeota archaeon]